jgi:hypothetical protein
MKLCLLPGTDLVVSDPGSLVLSTLPALFLVLASGAAAGGS